MAFQPPLKPLPLNSKWDTSEGYVDSLLSFVTTSDLFRNLCGGVHILDFLTRKPDLYSWVLPPEWREWFEEIDVYDLLHLLLREDLLHFSTDRSEYNTAEQGNGTRANWRGFHPPPRSLLVYIDTVRSLCLERSFEPVTPDVKPLPRHIAVGMKPKKIHEVENFAAFVNQLSTTASICSDASISSIVDFGSGQNYLGRTLACPPYDKHVIAIEQRHHNVEGARGMDVHAKLAKKEKIMRNKKEYKRRLAEAMANGTGIPTPPPELVEESSGTSTPTVSKIPEVTLTSYDEPQLTGSITYVERELRDGHLESVLHPPPTDTNNDSNHTPTHQPRSMVVSIHSCGNLTHHGLRSLTLNESVKAVAVIGCCYNLLSERLGPVTYKLPQLRPNHPRLEATGSTYDPHGFPMSKRLENFEYPVHTNPDLRYGISSMSGESNRMHYTEDQERREKGVRLNITARMMAVQAPYNWGREDSEAFFKRHFYRALLQRILLDLGVVHMATVSSTPDIEVVGGSLSGKDEVGSPLIIGSLKKSCFDSFEAYVAGALKKLYTDPEDGTRIWELTQCLREDPGLIIAYEEKYAYAKKHLSIIWSLMAFSAGVVESTIVVDRWLWLNEQPEVEHAWVQSVFDYKLSPRNLVVVGVRKEVNGSN